MPTAPKPKPAMVPSARVRAGSRSSRAANQPAQAEDRGRDDQGDLEGDAGVAGALGACGRAEQSHPGHHAEDREPLPQGQRGADDHRGETATTARFRGHHRLDREQGQPTQRDELGEEAEQSMTTLTTKRHWLSMRGSRPGSTPPTLACARDRLLASRTATTCMTDAVP